MQSFEKEIALQQKTLSQECLNSTCFETTTGNIQARGQAQAFLWQLPSYTPEGTRACCSRHSVTSGVLIAFCVSIRFHQLGSRGDKTCCNQPQHQRGPRRPIWEIVPAFLLRLRAFSAGLTTPTHSDLARSLARISDCTKTKPPAVALIT